MIVYQVYDMEHSTVQTDETVCYVVSFLSFPFYFKMLRMYCLALSQGVQLLYWVYRIVLPVRLCYVLVYRLPNRGDLTHLLSFF